MVLTLDPCKHEFPRQFRAYRNHWFLELSRVIQWVHMQKYGIALVLADNWHKRICGKKRVQSLIHIHIYAYVSGEQSRP